MDNNYNLTGMPDDDFIISKLETNLNETLTIQQTWREVEVRDSYAVFEGSQWLQEAIDRQTKNSMPIVNINRVSPVLEAICGFEIQNRMDIKYLPRILTEQEKGFSDLMNPTVKYIEQNTHAYTQYSMAFKDMLLCGMGVTDTVINYDNNPNGEVVVERVFPAFIFYDAAARAKNATDADWVIRLKVMNRDLIKQEYGTDYFDDIYNAALDSRILEFFSAVLAVKTLGVVYEYQWRQKEPFYRVDNPFLKIDPRLLTPDVAPIIENLKKEYAAEYRFNPDMDRHFSVEKAADVRKIKDTFEFIGLDLKSIKQHKYKYYRAVVTGGKVMEKSENYSQTGYSIKFMTGQFSELSQTYYGLMRFCKDPQRMLNQAVSDYLGFLATIPKGGVNIEETAVKNLPAFIETYTKAREVTVFKDGAISGGRMQPKITPPLPSGIFEMINYADQQIMNVCGVTPELMGMMNTKEQNTSFYKKQIKQGLTTLSTYFDAKATYMSMQANLYIDCVRVLLENSESLIIQHITGEGTKQFVPLFLDNIAQEYDVIIDEMPLEPDENNDLALKLIELQGMLLQSPQPANIMPIIVEYLDMKPEAKAQILQALQPPPPPEPDPLNTALLEAEAVYKRSSAAKMTAEAYEINVNTKAKELDIHYAPSEKEADIELTVAKTKNELHKAKKTQIDGLKNLIQH